MGPSSAQSRSNYSPCWSVNLLCTLPSSLWILRYFSLSAGKKKYSWPCVWIVTVISNPLRSFPNRHMLINPQPSIWGGPSADLWSHFLVQIPPLSYEPCLPWTPQTLSSISCTQEVCWASHLMHLPDLYVAWKVYQGSQWKPLLGSPCLFLVSKVSLVAQWISWKLVVFNYYYYYFLFLYFVLLKITLGKQI